MGKEPKLDPNPDAATLIAAHALFKGLQPATLDLLSRQAQTRTLGKGELLFNLGDAPGGMFVIVDGRMRIWAVSASGVEVTLNVLTPGAVFGEIGMLDDSERTAGASGMAPTRLLLITRRVFFDALDRDPKLARNAIDLLCQRLRWVSARMEDAALRQAPQRLARLVAHLARDHGTKTKEGIEIAIKLTQGELAQWTAMSRENLNKLLVGWADEGVLTQSRAGITVHELERLDDIAEFGA
jgi:CRP/FNR family transcriptional regulator, cyclic AMP receptor protein